MSPDPRIDELLERWEDLQEQGQTISVEELCEACPELVEDVRQELARLRWVAKLLEVPSHNQHRELAPACQVGRYRLDELIGEGGFGQVWRGFDPELDRVVAVKILRPERHRSILQIVRFLDEAKKAAKLRHPHIVSVFDSGRDQNLCYMVTEFVSGTDLAKRLQEGALPRREAVGLVIQIAEALQHAHERGVIHRDIKPQNILLDQQGVPYLSDFSVAVTSEELQRGTAGSAGTPAYMSPEQSTVAAQGDVDARADVYSLGLVLYELLLGRLPQPGQDGSQSHGETGVPNRLLAICLKAVSFRREDRWQTAQEFADQLREWFAGSSGARDTRRLGSLALWLVGGLSVLGIIVATLLMAWSMRRSDQPPLSAIEQSGPSIKPALETLENSLGMRFVLIPPGEFWMGSPHYEAQRQNEPQHRVRITRPYYLATHEVTVALYQQVTGVISDSQAPDLPVVNTTWDDAVAFCQKLSQLPAERDAGRMYRLPTEAEWEYACRAGTTGRFSASEQEILQYVWSADTAGDRQIDAESVYHTWANRDEGRYAEYMTRNNLRLRPVGTKLPNPWGLYDMHGSVWEWCADFYDAKYYLESPVEDPTGPPLGEARVARGGSYTNPLGSCRSARRAHPGLTERLRNGGIRVALSLPLK